LNVIDGLKLLMVLNVKSNINQHQT